MSPESTGKSTEQGTKTDGAKSRGLRLSLPLAVVLIGVLAVLGVCWMFYQNQVATKQEYLMERNFRYLKGHGEILVEAIAGYEKMFQSILEAPSLGKEQADDNGVRECGPGSQHKTVEKNKTTEKTGTAEEPEPTESPLVEKFCNLPHMKRVAIKEVLKKKQEDLRSGGPFEARFIGNDLLLDYRYSSQAHGTQKKGGSPGSTQSWHITAQVNLAEIMNLLPVEELFGICLLTDSRGTVVHEQPSARHASEYQFANIADLIKMDQGKQGDKDREPKDRGRIVPPIFEEFSKGKTKYLIFGQAGRWPFGQATAKKDQARQEPSKKDKEEQEPFDFLVVGILPSHDYYVQAETIPTSYLFVAIGLILGGALSLPYLRLQSMRSSDALSQGDVFALLYCTVLWVGVATFLVVILATYWSTRAEFDEKLKEAADKINGNFVRDLEDAKEQLNKFDQWCKKACVKNGKLKAEPLWSEELTIDRYDSAQKKYELKLKNPAESDGKTHLLFYDLSKVLWVDKEGEKRVDWSWEFSERQLPLREREYFKQILSGEPFWVESIYSLTTGEHFAMVSKKSDVSADGKSPFVVALQGKLPSVMDAVVLPGMGFAVIDQEGKVQFHSDSHRNLREDFFAETDHDEQLRAAVWTGISEPFSGQYWGKDRRFYVTPVKWEGCTNPGTDTGQKCLQGGKGTQEAQGPPKWSLVVYLDQDVLEAPLLEAGFFAMALFVLYALMILGVGLFGLLIYRLLKSEQGGPIWPQEEHSRTYAAIIILNFALLVFYGLTTFRLVPDSQNESLPLLGIFLLPVVPIVIAIVVIRYRAGWWFPKGLVRYYRFWYLLMSVSSLLLIAMLPAFYFFTMAYNEEMRLYAEFSQYDYRKDSEEGRKRLRDFYATKGESKLKKPIDGQENGFADELLKHRDRKLEGLPVETFLFSPTQQPTLSNLLPVYATVRRLFTTQFGTETGRFLEKRTDLKDLENPKKRPPAVPCYLYWGLIIFGLLPCVLKGTVPKDISIRPFVLFVLSIGFFVVLIRPEIGFRLMSALVFACVSYGLTSMVARQVFFLWEEHKDDSSQGDIQSLLEKYSPSEKWALSQLAMVAGQVFLLREPREDGVSQGDVRVQWDECSLSEKWALTHLAQDRFLTAKSEGLTGLKEKRLVRFKPNPQLVNEEHRAIIKKMFKKEETSLLQSLEEEEPLNWREQAIWAMLIGLAGFILFTQEEFRPAVLAALAPALTTLLRLPPGLDLSKLLELLPSKKKG